MSKVSIIITSFLRPQLLEWNLFSLAQQEIPFDFETIVLNDGLPDETERLCSQYAKKLNVKYVFTGQRNLNGRLIYRVSGFAVNIGARLAKGEILIISCAEMFHLNNTIAQLAIPVTLNHKLLATSIGMDDRTGSFLEYVITSNGRYDITAYYNCYRLNTTLPFLMAINKNELYAVGGYDEVFTGCAFYDNELISR
jgi:glycosyltransferase involved in cell wall biosynthesis